MRRIAVLMVLTVTAMSGCSNDSSKSMSAATNTVAATVLVETTDAVRTMQVKITDFAYQPSSFEVAIGETVRFEFVNNGLAVHSPLITSTATTDAMSVELATGETGSLTVTFSDAGDLRIVCSQPGHEGAGEVAVIHVT